MRSDMSKVLVERPRYSDYGDRKGRKIDHDLLPSKEGMRSPHVRNWGGKRLNENLSPLRRLIESRVGRPWNKVYSEICQHLRGDNTVQQHVKDHIEDFVAIRTSMMDGQVVIHSKYGSPRLLHSDSTELYVDPVTGILCRNKTKLSDRQERKLWKAKKAAEEASRIHIGKNGTEYRKVDGIWYEVIWDKITKLLETYRVQNGNNVTIIIPDTQRDIFTNEMHNEIGESYRSGKRQISKKELRDLGLNNG
jgi:hypothetical protein